MAKKKVEKPERELTKHQLSRWQQQKRRQRFIFGAGMAIIIAVLGIFGVGVYSQWYIPEYKPLREVVIEVNDAKFNMDYYIKMLKFYGQGVDPQYLSFLADQVVTTIEQNELMKQGAAKFGFSVSDEEVDKKLNSYDPPLSKDYRDLLRASMLRERLLDEYFGPQVPTYQKTLIN